ncbi:MAG: transposase [Nitrosomonas sp.]|nr:transposase [Nitrosomonas sp.]MDP3664874.1 transposase [Nitrosomonas sp.]MDZ4107635.1 transposase [Nitrosomonas sp.]
MAAAETSNENQQPTLHFIDHSDKVKLWEYAILVTNTDYSLDAIGQLYRDRADCENGFDELKNQWGWGGIPRMIWNVATSRRGQSRSSTIGGVGMSDWHI